jgi:2-(1,2-epoxy-1,2-dihydrophenyl)acetyl-CoA isomerase
MAKLDTGTDELLCSLDDGIATVTLNRPDKRNALSDRLTPALREILLVLERNEDARCIIITGAGPAFCAGGDISGMGGDGSPRHRQSRGAATRELIRREETLSLRLYELATPTIAALPGAAAGAGLSIALACDFRIGAASAFIKTAFANIGLPGDYGGTWLLTRLVGPAKAKALYFMSPRVDAAECLALGIFDDVVSDDTLQLRASDMARTIAAGPPIAIGLMKARINAAADSDLRACLNAEAHATIHCMETADHAEGVRAFMEKRPPQFGGH